MDPSGLFGWMTERQRIWRARQAGKPRPWTNDPILAKYSFTNVFRELDTTTIWIRENWREPYRDHQNLPLAMGMARLLNWPPALQELGFPERWSRKAFVRAYGARYARGEKCITGAHLVNCDAGDACDKCGEVICGNDGNGCTEDNCDAH